MEEIEMKRKIALILMSSILALSACTASKEPTADEIVQNFYTNTHQIKSQMRLTSDNVSALLEGYMDASGYGSGLLSVGNVICEVTFVNNDMYVDVLDNTYCIENMGYQLSFDKLRTQNTTTEELNQLGFTLGSNDITAFSSTIDNVQITNQYAKSSKIIEPCEVTKDIVIPLNDFLRLLSRVNTSKADDIPIIGELSKEQEEEQETEPVEEEKSSYYLNSELGIKINNQTFSVDDYINIKDYFFDTTPEGINYKEEWDKDTKVTLCYASYIDTTGKFTAMSINNIVYKLAADCDFEFLGFSAGQSIEEINRILGIKLNSKDKKDFKPLRDDIVITKTGNNFIRFTVGDYKVRFGFDKSKALSSMTIEKERDYKKYDND